MSTKQLKMDLSYTYQTTSIGLEIRTVDELQELLSVLQDEDCSVVVLHDHHRKIMFHVYLRFRE